MEVEVIYNIWDKVSIKWWCKEYEIIWYEYIQPVIKYIILDWEWNYKYCLPIELLKIEKSSKIWFIYKQEEWNEPQTLKHDTTVKTEQPNTK